VTAIELIPNILPVAGAGADQTLTLPANSLTLAGTASDSDGIIAAYNWTKVSGPAATLAGANSASLAVSALTAGTYVFRLTVTDNTGDAAFDEVTITVKPNLLPMAVAGADQTLTLPANSLTLTGTGSDSDGTIAAYNWTKVSGPAATLAGANTASLTAGSLGAGTYVFRLTVTDNGGATAFDEVTITVNNAPVAGQQVISFTLVNAATGQDIRNLVPGETINLATLPSQNLNIRANTNPVTIGSVKMALSGAQVKNVTETGAPYALYGDNKGNYNSWVPAIGSFTLVATPYTGAGASGTAGTPLTISFQVITQASGNLAPGANAGTDKVLTLPVNALTLTGSGTDSDGTIASYSWTRQSGPAAILTDASSASLTAGSLVAGTYVFRLTVTDNGGATAFDEVTVTVNNAPVAGQQVTTLMLVNAATDQDIRALVPGETIDLAALPSQNLNIRAITNPASVGSVKFALSGAQVKNTTETGAPYALYGDKDGNYNAWVPAVGSFTLVATPYTGAGGGGTAGTPLSLSFSVVNRGSAARRTITATVQEALQPGAVLLPYPNPTSDGRFQVLLPEAVAGEIAYELVSATGASITKGKLQTGPVGSVLEFDLSRHMQNSGLYYLRLQGPGLNRQLKLQRR
jgi:hypothetical protein